MKIGHFFSIIFISILLSSCSKELIQGTPGSISFTAKGTQSNGNTFAGDEVTIQGLSSDLDGIRSIEIEIPELGIRIKKTNTENLKTWNISHQFTLSEEKDFVGKAQVIAVMKDALKNETTATSTLIVE